MGKRQYKIFSKIVMVVFLLLSISIDSNAKDSSLIDSGKYGDNLKWELSEEGELIISGEGEMVSISDDESYPWMKYYDCIKEVKILNGVTSIGDKAFRNIESLWSVEMPESLTEIGEYSFSNCRNMEFADIPNSVTKIGKAAFSDCWSLFSINVGPNVTIIEEDTFYKCCSVIGVKIGKNIVEIGENAFFYCQFIHASFGGSKEQWDKVVVESGNDYLKEEMCHYNGKGNVIIDYHPATCMDAESVYFTCDACDLDRSYGIGTTIDHKIIKVGKIDATCETDGYTVYECTMCGERERRDIVKASGHKFVDGSCVNCFKSTGLQEQKITAKNITKIVSSSVRTVAINAARKGSAKLTYKSNNKNITVNSKGTITIKKNYIGKATITITAAKTSKYKKATKKITVTVKPAKAKITSLRVKNRKAIIKIKKNIGNVKYQIQFSANKNFDSVKKVSVNYNKQGYLIDYKLKTGKKYYYRVRGMKSVNGTTFYGKWSDVKQVKVPKAL